MMLALCFRVLVLLEVAWHGVLVLYVSESDPHMATEALNIDELRLILKGEVRPYALREKLKHM